MYTYLGIYIQAIEYHCAMSLENNGRTTSKHARHNKEKIQRALSEIENRLKGDMQKILLSESQGLNKIAGSDAAQGRVVNFGSYNPFRLHKGKLPSLTERSGIENNACTTLVFNCQSNTLRFANRKGRKGRGRQRVGKTAW